MVLPIGSGRVAPGTGQAEEGFNSCNPPTQENSTATIPTVVVSSDTSVLPNSQPSQVQEEHLVSISYPKKQLYKAYLLWSFFGIFGAHHFYLRRYEFGFLYFFTLGLFGIGWIGDLFRLPKLVRRAKRKIKRPEIEQRLDVFDAYAMWFPFGIFGLHHFYMGRVSWGIVYSWTLGLFGLGWLFDLFIIPSLVHQANKDLSLQRAMENQPRNSELTTAYLLGITPAGLLGCHHFYMGQWSYRLFYMYTLGGAGIGWICDWFRMHKLVKRVNNPDQYPLKSRQKHLDSAYVCAIPFGLFGAHHFYFGNPKMGTIYFFTVGLFGIGWLNDLCLMSSLVEEANSRLTKEQELVAEIRRRQRIRATADLPPGGLTDPHMFHHNIPGYPINMPLQVREIPIIQPPSYEGATSQPYNPPNFIMTGERTANLSDAPAIVTLEQNTNV